MENLKIVGSAITLSCFFLSACGVSTTLTQYVETDTYITNTDPGNHSELSYLKVSNTGNGEERSLVKLPTGKQDTDESLSAIFKDPAATIVLAPFIVLAEILQQIFSCTSKTLAPELLTSAKLVFDVTQTVGTPNLSNQVSLALVARPWFQTSNWTQAHGFSSSGNWAQPGGDMDASFTPLASTHVNPAANSGTLEFDVTTYFRSLISSQTPHYGLELRSTHGAALNAVTLASSQYSAVAQRPRLVSTYRCITPGSGVRSGFGMAAVEAEPEAHTFILGTPRL
jgi:hypothetical protein